MKRAVLAVVFLLFCLRTAMAQAPVTPAPETVPAFIDRLQTALRSGDREAYLGLLAPEVREAEAARIATYFDELKMTGVSIRTAGVRTAEDGSARAFAQAFYENATGAVI